MNSVRSYRGDGYTGPPVSKVRTNTKTFSSWNVRMERVSSHSAALQQETRYVFLPDHDRDYLLMKAAATHTLVERGAEKGKE